MDELSLEIGEHSWADGPLEPAVIIRINGRRLEDLIVASAREHLHEGAWEGDVHPPGLWRDFLVRWSDVPGDQALAVGRLCWSADAATSPAVASLRG